MKQDEYKRQYHRIYARYFDQTKALREGFYQEEYRLYSFFLTQLRILNQQYARENQGADPLPVSAALNN
jgi:hypothetical protein